MRPDQAQQLLKQLRNDYIAELPGFCDELENLVLSLDNLPGKECFEELYRRTHSMKGSAGTHGLSVISSICHEFEEQLSKLGNLAEVELDSLLVYIDLVRQAVAIAETGNEEFSKVEKRLQFIRDASLHNLSPVLLVESSDYVRLLCRQALEHLPIELSMASDGLEALGQLLRSKYALVITAKEAKTLNGMALISAVQASESKNRHIWSILLTSSSNLKLGDCTRPDYVINRDAKFGENLARAVKEILRQLNG